MREHQYLLFFCAAAKRLTAFVLATVVLSVGYPNRVDAWSLKTHAWIAQQVLNDALDDGSFELAGKLYAVPPHILSALKNHPERFRMGSLGPDVFPDPIVGQTTTHPGVPGGWQADDWLKNLLNSAKNDEERAFAYGFIAHGAGDVFAHTYVNTYAGDIFVLTDDEREVELRHFVLEKYIESLTPPALDLSGTEIDLEADFGTATSFARDALFMNGQASIENARARSGIHLTAMYQVRERVRDLENGTQKIISTLTEWGSKYFSEELKLQTGLTEAKIAVEIGLKGVDAAEELLRAKQKVRDAQLAILDGAKNIVVKHPELITAQQLLLLKQIKIVADLGAESVRVAAEVQNAIDEWERKITNLHGQILSKACDALWFEELKKRCRNGISGLVKEIQGIRDKITAANDRKRVAQDVVAAADHLRDEIKKYIDKLQSELNDATRGLAEGTYEAAVKLAELEFQIQQRLVKESREVLLKAREVVADLERKLDEIAKFTRPVKEALDRYNPITLLIRNWLKDIDIASEEYIKASHRAGLLMLRSEGNPLAEYVEWHSCYGQVFMAVPKEVGQAGCLGKRYLEEISAVYDRFLEQLPELIQWIAAPTWKMRKIVEPAIKDALQEATIKVVGFLTDKSTAEFIDLLSNPKNADRGRLVEIYRRDASGKGLIVFNDVASIVDRDLAISDGVLDPEKFAPLKHSVTLAKLAILDVISLNQLVRDIIGDAPQPARDYFNGSGDNYSLLIGMVRSLDGNHQWQAYGLPYPRRLGVQHGDPIGSHYGYDGHSDPSKGLVIWTDEFLREKVFYTLFPTAVIGALQERPELKWRHYKFPTCAQNPFPSTQDSSGRIRSEGDQTCPAVSDATVPIPENSPDNPTEYQERYFRCSAADAGLQYTIAGPFRNKLTAQIVARKLTRKFPDMHLEVWKPIRQTTYWPVMLAACVPLKTAQQARDLGLRRRVDTQITVDRGRLPWAPQANSTKEHGLIGISTPLATTSTSRKINSYPLK